MTMRSAVAFPDDAVESADSDEEDDKPPKILRFNGDKISLHKTNGNGNGRRAATGGASQIIIASFPRPNPTDRKQKKQNIPTPDATHSTETDIPFPPDQPTTRSLRAGRR
jgi:hypothetical protein